MRIFYPLLCLAVAQNSCIAKEVRHFDRNAAQYDGQLIAGFECNVAKGQMAIGLFPSHDLPKKDFQLWDTFDLKKNTEEGDTVEEVFSVVRSCALRKHFYKVKLTGEPGNWNLNGECGGVTFAKAKVWKDGKLVFDDDIFNCQDYRSKGEHQPTLILFRPAIKIPTKRNGKTKADLYK